MIRPCYFIIRNSIDWDESRRETLDKETGEECDEM